MFFNVEKVTAFAGIDIPIDCNGDEDTENRGLGAGVQALAMLPATVRTTLKGQAFIRVDRITTMLDSVMAVAVEKTPEMREMLQLYVDNNVSRAVLVKPIQVEIDQTKSRMLTVLNSCVDPGQSQRDLMQQLDAVIGVVVSELAFVANSTDISK